MKHLYILLSFVVVSLLFAETAFAQQEVTIRELNTYPTTVTDQSDLPSHPLNGQEVTFDAVVVAYPKNSGLATPDKGEFEAEPGRIHLFVTDVNAINDGREGMSMQLVVEGAERTTLESLDRGDVISIVGNLTFYGGSESQFNATNVTYLGAVSIPGSPYTNLAPLLEPMEIDLSQVNQPLGEGHTWVPEAYSKYIHTYVKFTGLEIINRLEGADGNRPWFQMSDGNTALLSTDISLRYRNDRGTYAFKVETDQGSGTQDTVLSLNYNYRRIDEEDPNALDGVFSAPAPGSVVDVSGFLVIDDFDPEGTVDADPNNVTFRIAPWEDGIRWTQDGTDTTYRITTGIPNDLEVRGYAPILDQFTVTPDSGVSSTDDVTVSVDVLKAENDYTVKNVDIIYSTYAYTEDAGTVDTVAMTGSGTTYTHTFRSLPEFTNVEFEVVAYTETPDGVLTRARQSGSYQVVSSTQTAPVVFSPTADATYENSVMVELSSNTPDAAIYYTLDGSDPVAGTSAEYTTPLTLTENTTIKAIATVTGMSDSPVNTRNYVVAQAAIETATLAGIRAGTAGDVHQYTGEAVVTFARPSNGRNQKFLMDASGGLLIDDYDGIITSTYEIGDVMSGVTGEVSVYNGLTQFLPSIDPGAPTKTAEVTPVKLTLAELDISQHESMLVEIEGVSFEETGTFTASENYSLTDASLSGGTTVAFRTNFGEADYIGEAIPEGSFKLTALVGRYYSTLQLTARNKADMEMGVSNELESPEEFALLQNYPNPFNPTTTIKYSVADVANVKLQVFDILGRNVATLVNDVKTPGAYTVNFNAASLSSGTYFYRIEAGDFTSIRKMMLIK